jgi:endonuclease YncB( thermonuclease family)
MTRRLLAPLLLIGLLALPAAAAAGSRGPCIAGAKTGPHCTIWYGKVAYVDDGDTMHVRVDGRVQHIRIAGIQAMELTRYSTDPRRRAGQCHAVEAADRLDQLVRRAKGRVRVAAQDLGSESRPRPLRAIAVLLRGRWHVVGRTLIKEGLVLWMPAGREWAWNPRNSVLVERAQAARLGLWNTSYCGEGPSEGAPIKLWVNWKSDSSYMGDPDGEWVKIRNLDPVNPLALGGWWLRDSGLREYRFPGSAQIPPAGVITVHVGTGFDDGTDFYWGQRHSVFNDVSRSTESGDGAYLFDPQGDMRAWMTYPCRTTCADPNAGSLVLGVRPRTSAEYLTVRDVGPVPVALEGYRITVGSHVYAFPSQAVLQPGETLRLYTKDNPDDDTRLSLGWGSDWTVLPDRGGVVRLSTFTDSVLACVAWGGRRC